MALKDIWKDLQDAVAGDENSGSELTVTPINNIAHSVIKNEDDISKIKDLDTADVEITDDVLTISRELLIKDGALQINRITSATIKDEVLILN